MPFIYIIKNQKGSALLYLIPVVLILALSFLAAYFFLLPKKETPKPVKKYLVGALIGQDAHIPAFDGFKEKMTELGYTEGSNITYEIRNGKGDSKLVSQYAKELISKNPDVIVTSSTSATKPVIDLTKTIPIVFLAAGNTDSLVKSTPFSGANITGISTGESDISGKRLETLKQLDPSIKTVGIVYNPSTDAYKRGLEVSQDAAKKLNITLVPIEISTLEDATQAATTLSKQKYQALTLIPSGGITTISPPLIEAAIEKKIPTSCATEEAVNKGCLTTLASDLKTVGIQGAALVNKIFQGFNPGDIAIDKALKYNLIFNLQTAKKMGLTIPQTLITSADKIIE